ncbi:DgyrCDS3495 [Dimorphilus gyrociliatus]|uniref:Trifunctional purine biosynthetic protein adenosine-3 n=1 Tax=Dimorphilus gyrociliatus TaxID=2664684 RepID=A0A7I8VFB2_9ANNE|nr:DgyrCDS3495 [Dimorphilus gyrociliatus]
MTSILVIGSGGREHALAWKLSRSSRVDRIFVGPGNPGVELLEKCKRIDLRIDSFKEIAFFCQKENVSTVVVGPEDPLANGISDYLHSQGIKCFGPTLAASRIESSKAFAKEFMTKYNIPTAEGKCFSDLQSAMEFVNKWKKQGLVVKASGLAAGKGVYVNHTKVETIAALETILRDKKFGSAGENVIIEELLEGEEVSCLAFSDGVNVVCLPTAQDYKRLQDWDVGPNTGGMGAYSPCSWVTNTDLEDIKTRIIQPTIDGLRKEGCPYIGLLYAGIMMTRVGPMVLEFNCRFGDPEAQVILPKLETDLYDIIEACLEQKLNNIQLRVKDGYAVATVAVSKGYPNKYEKGKEICGLDSIPSDGLVFHAGTSKTENSIVTNGGRVLSVVCLENNLKLASQKSLSYLRKLDFDGISFRNDIGLTTVRKKLYNLTYEKSGVDINLADEFIHRIKPLAKMTKRTGTVSDLGLFGGVFDPKLAGYDDSLLVSGTDGVGTKLKIAQEVGKFDTIGIDLVAMCVNDIIAHGAEPLFFLDYLAVGKLNLDEECALVKGISDGCCLSGCTLLGGETAEMPGLYKEGDFDLAGFSVGAVRRADYLPRINDIKEGDILIGLPSNGVHSNGFSLVRKILSIANMKFSTPFPLDEKKTIGEVLLEPTRIYVKDLLPLIRGKLIKAFAHITGGGIPGNLVRVLPENLDAYLNANDWTIPPSFGILAEIGKIDPVEMLKTFNCGLGGILVVEESDAEKIVSILKDGGLPSTIVGKIAKNAIERVHIENFPVRLRGSAMGYSYRSRMKKHVAVLISGSGTNLQALINECAKPGSSAEIRVVISNKPNVKGLQRAFDAGIPSIVVQNRKYSSREKFDNAISEILEEFQIDTICLAGFMRILSGGFVNRWRGRILNVHPSLLPSFKGANAHKLVLSAGVRISGCSVHFVEEEVDSGAIICQESVPVYSDDTEESLAARVKEVEHRAFPKALQLVTSGKVTLDLENNKIIWK